MRNAGRLITIEIHTSDVAETCYDVPAHRDANTFALRTSTFDFLMCKSISPGIGAGLRAAGSRGLSNNAAKGGS